jgi:hypothetical protein
LIHHDDYPLCGDAGDARYPPRDLWLKSIVWMDIIHGMDIKHFDLNLLRVFDALLTEGQVTLAGKKLNRSQNTISTG